MKLWLKIIAALLLGSIGGAVGLTLLTLVLHWVLVPQLLEYWLAPIITVPIGAVLGTITGILIVASKRIDAKESGIFSVFGAFVGAITTFLWVAPYDWHKLSVFYVIGLPLMWILGILIYGLKRLKNHTLREVISDAFDANHA